MVVNGRVRAMAETQNKSDSHEAMEETLHKEILFYLKYLTNMHNYHILNSVNK